MIPVLRSSSARSKRKGVWAMSLVFIAILSILNLHHLLYHQPQDSTNGNIRATTSEIDPQSSLPPDFVDFVKSGGFDDSSERTPATQPVEATLRIEETRHSNALDFERTRTESQEKRPEKTVTTETDETKQHKGEQPQQHKKKHRRYYGKDKTPNHNGFPPLHRLVSHDEETKEDKITGPVDWLLDFAILGHAKCATTYLMNWLRQHEKVQMHGYEVCDLNNRQPASLVRKLFTELPAGEQFMRGFKCPGHFSREPLRYFRQYLQKTKLIVGLRHPVRWFERYVGTNPQVFLLILFLCLFNVSHGRCFSW